MNDLKTYQRPCTSGWKLNDKVNDSLCAKLDVDWTDFEALCLNESWKSKDAFVDICCAADLEVIFAKSLKELSRRAVMVIPEWKGLPSFL